MIVVGVDVHKQSLTAVAVDEVGRTVEASRVKSFQEGVLGVETISVADGLGKGSGESETNRLLRKLAGEDGSQPVFNPARVARRAEAFLRPRGQGVRTKGELRRGIVEAGEERNVGGGLTINGKPGTMDDLWRQAREQQEQEERKRLGWI